MISFNTTTKISPISISLNTHANEQTHNTLDSTLSCHHTYFLAEAGEIIIS
jgi:hypothetical protein